MKIKLNFLVVFFFGILSLLPLSLKAQAIEEFKKEYFIQKDDTLNYRILYPENFSKKKKYPVVLFLHGAGERGSDNTSQLGHGSPLFLNAENRKKYPAIVVFPQAPKDDYWAKVEVKRDTVPFEFNFKNREAPNRSLKLVMELMDSLVAQKYTDEDRIYVGGLSMGGMGTYEIILKRPQMFAAAFAICGGADPEIAKDYPEGFNIWIFHGEKDEVVPSSLSKSMARSINHYGGNAKLSLYPDYNHNSWDAAFAEPYLLPWLFSQNRDGKQAKHIGITN